ncbi:MAG: GNAT family protein [Sporolactobacillus sp.]
MTRVELHERWQKRMQDFETSDLTGKEWCATHGIPLCQFRYWRRKLRHNSAFGLWTDYLFQAMPEIVRVDLRTWSGNFGMMKLAEKLGYTKEACFRKARIVNGKYYDSIGYGVLREEWDAWHPQGFQKDLIANS